MKTKKLDLRTLPVGRKPVKARSPFRRLFAVTGANRLHATPAMATPSDLEGDVPNMNVGRAITVIVILHILCIGGYFLREKIAKDKAAEASIMAHSSSENTSMLALNPISGIDDLPAIQPGQKQHLVSFAQRHANYAAIAKDYGITEQALRQANNNITIAPGINLRIPARTAEAIVPDELNRLKNRNQGTTTTSQGTAILARPSVDLQAAPRVTQIIQSPSAATTGAAKVHTVKKGETFYSIARMHGISIGDLQGANPVSKPSQLKIGANLKVPVQ
jgi:LysM repeat protein